MLAGRRSKYKGPVPGPLALDTSNRQDWMDITIT